MPTTFSYKNDQDADERASPASELNARESAAFGGISQNYDSSTADPAQEDANIAKASDVLGEAEDKSYIPSSYSGGNKKSSGRIKGLVKRGGPMGLIGGGLLGMAGIVSFFGGPGMLIVHVTEVLEEKLNQRVSFTEARYNRVVRAKIENSTTGKCGGEMTIRCKFATFSDKEIENLNKDSRLKVTTEPNKTVLSGQNKLASLEYEGRTITPREFHSLMRTDPVFARIIWGSYGGTGNPRFLTVWDKISDKVRKVRGILRSNQLAGAKTDEERAAAVKKTANTSPELDATVHTDNPCDKPDANCSEEEKQRQQQHQQNVSNTATAIAEDAATDSTAEQTAGKKWLRSIRSGVGAVGTKISASLGVVGVLDQPCTVYGGALGVGRAMKIKRAAQMMRFAMIIFTTGSMIKAGDAIAEDVSYVGTMLTKTVKYEDGSVSLAATDGFGYRSAAYGDKGMTDNASLYIIGASFGAAAAGILTSIINQLGGIKEAKKTCGIVKNPVVMGASIIGGIALLLVPGVNVAQVVKTGAQVGLAVSLSLLMPMILSKLTDIITGNLVDNETFGETALDIAVPGFAKMHEEIAAAGGGAPLTPEQAVAYQKVRDDTNTQLAMYDRATLSPLDASNPNTVMGSIYSAGLRYISPSFSPSSVATSLSRITGSIGSNIFPSAKAEPSDFTTCEDPDYREIGVATDQFCVPQRGIPAEYLDTDPDTIITRLTALDLLDPQTYKPTAKFINEFVNVCIDRELPIGDSGDDFQGNPGADCFIKDNTGSRGWLGTASAADKAMMYLYKIDTAALDVMENGIEAMTQAKSGSSPTGSALDTFTIPDNVEMRKNGWRLKNNTDYSQYPCPSDSEDAGVATNTGNGITIRRCKVSGQIVSSIIASRVIAIVNDAKVKGVNLTPGSSLRSYEEQQKLYAKNCKGGKCRPPTATPGSSNHERGLAVDWQYKGSTICYPNSTCSPGSNPGYDFLMENGEKYGFKKLKSEAWHWSMDGT